MAEIKVAQVSQIAPATGTIVDVEGNAIAIFHVGGTFYAIANACTHMGGPLGEGTIDGRDRHLPLARQPIRRDIRSRKEGPARRPVATYPVRIRGDDVFIVLEETPS